MARSPRRLRPSRALGLAVAAAALAASPALAAFVIDGTVANVPGNLQPAAEPSIVLGALTGAGSPRVPWIAQTQPAPDGGPAQVFVEKFAGAFLLQGGALNLNPAVDAAHPSIDFAGPRVAVPWVAWAETAGGVPQIFASRFLPNADLANGVWEPNGALRVSEGDPSVQRGPSLNLHTDRAAGAPRLAGGATTAAGEPAPWVAWQEEADVGGVGTQIYVARGVRDRVPGATQAGNFTWHPVGVDRGTIAADPARLGPSLNVVIGDTTNALHPDIAFGGPGRLVPWVVWYEEPDGVVTPTAPNNRRVFAAKLVPAAALGDRLGRWIPVGNGPACVFDLAIEDRSACALNHAAGANAENPNVAAGSLDPAQPPAPWVVWHEEGTPAGINGIVVSRLSANGLAFEAFPGPNENGSLNASPAMDADAPDLRFEANVLYVTWTEAVAGGKYHAFERRFTPGPGGTGTWSTAVPLQAEPTVNAGGPAIGSFGGTPFVIWAEGVSTGGGPVRGSTVLKHDSAVAAAQTTPATDVSLTSATLNGIVAGDPGVYAAAFEYGPTSAYGQVLPVGDVTHSAPGTGQPFSAPLTGLQPGQVVHYRASLHTALGTLSGVDQAFTTTAAPGTQPPPAPTTPTTTTPTTPAVPAKPKLHRVRVVFPLQRRGIVTFEVHRRTARGALVSRHRRAFARGRHVQVLPIRGTGRYIVLIKARGARTIARPFALR